MKKISLKNNIVVNYVKNSIRELKKVTWPSKKDTINHTLLVIGISLAVAAFLGAIDYVFSLGLENLIAR